ncbi:28S ribosomal protein S18b, mitochondrial-like [Pomacea canaliculata]|uniref:28S ribosomal protein S18b, mitochondrial-like n=1 Tax=Pomacea canaliculata TaxID=400727 RepID=UPI000D73E7EB|nr:28S ribosomal protein S18b, mitochondrial-like [Pomacea canaliculata]
MAAVGLWRVTSSALFCRFVIKNTQTKSFPASRNICFSVSQHAAAKDAEGEDSGKPKRLIVDPDTSIRYMNSKAYEEAYGGNPVWFHYRRNFKGQVAPRTRRTCIRQGIIKTASPCPICRDEYLIVDHKNVKLLEQFISPYTGEVLNSRKTGVCQVQHKKLVIEVMKARIEGLVEKVIPIREYDYDQYYDQKTGKVL